MKKLSQKGFAPILIILIAMIVAGGAGVLAWKYKLIKKTSSPVPTTILSPSPTPSQSANEIFSWEVYNNQIHNFEIKYPKDWMLQKEVGVPPATVVGRRWDDNGYCSMNLLIVENNIDSSAEIDWYRKNGYKEEAYSIAGMSGTKFSKFPVENNGPVAVIYFKNTSDRIDMIASADKYQECAKIFDGIISSFKFLDSKDETANWKTYKDEKTGAEFKYPEKFGANVWRADSWPPKLIVVSGSEDPLKVGCSDLSPNASSVPVEINGQDFIFYEYGDGAAGSTYTTYCYITKKNNNYYVLDFFIRTTNGCGTNCGPYCETQFEAECKNLDIVNEIDKPIEKIVSTLKLAK